MLLFKSSDIMHLLKKSPSLFVGVYYTHTHIHKTHTIHKWDQRLDGVEQSAQ